MAPTPKKIKAQCYTILVRPITEYACIIWDPITQKNIRQLDMVQRRAARFVNGDYKTTSSVTQMLVDPQWIELQERRKQAKVIMLYRKVNQPSHCNPANTISNTEGRSSTNKRT